jgi:hypothetical protein
MSPKVDQESTFDDTEKGGNAHNLFGGSWSLLTS